MSVVQALFSVPNGQFLSYRQIQFHPSPLSYDKSTVSKISNYADPIFYKNEKSQLPSAPMNSGVQKSEVRSDPKCSKIYKSELHSDPIYSLNFKIWVPPSSDRFQKIWNAESALFRLLFALSYRWINPCCPAANFQISPKIRFNLILLSSDKFHGYDKSLKYKNLKSAPVRKFKAGKPELRCAPMNLTKPKNRSLLRSDEHE